MESRFRGLLLSVAPLLAAALAASVLLPAAARAGEAATSVDTVPLADAPAVAVPVADATVPAVTTELPADPLDPSAEAPLIDPLVERRELREVRIDTENIEFGIYGGLLSIEDFGTSPVGGAMLAWHFTEDLFIQAHAYAAEGNLSSYEVLSGGTRLLTGDERELVAYNLSVGYNVFPGEAFIGRKRALNTAFYVLGGLGSTSFGGEDRFTLSIGVGYRLLINDFLAWHIGYRDHVFASDVTGQDKNTHNIELNTGLTTFF